MQLFLKSSCLPKATHVTTKLRISTTQYAPSQLILAKSLLKNVLSTQATELQGKPGCINSLQHWKEPTLI